MLTVVRGLVLGTLIALFLAAAPSPMLAQDRDYDEQVFYEELAPYGEWSDHPRWGNVWRPRVSEDWRPYSHGYWAYTEEHGWYWMAEEPYGWAVFHYGRWALDEYDGWIWIPGSEWGPAWVAWRDSDEYVGWAPLPPDARWGSDGQLFYDERYYDEPRYASAAWCFVHPAYLTTPGLYRFLAPGPQNYLIWRRTQPVYGYRRLDRASSTRDTTCGASSDTWGAPRRWCVCVRSTAPARMGWAMATAALTSPCSAPASSIDREAGVV